MSKLSLEAFNQLIEDISFFLSTRDGEVNALRPRLDMFLNHVTSVLNDVTSEDQLEQLRLNLLVKKGPVSAWAARVGKIDPTYRADVGAAINVFRQALQAAFNNTKDSLRGQRLDKELQDAWVDISLPGRPEGQGTLHPIGQVMDELGAIFGEMGFTWADGPDIEDDWHNFTALNIPPDHPARQMQDTFYLPPRADGTPMVLRTHTSPVQARTMLGKDAQKRLADGGSLRIIVPGRTYRIDSDATHTPMFHQVEGLVIDRTTHMGHLKGCLVDFCRAFFEVDDLPLRFRPSYFPFTEPSAEVDIGCSWKDGELRIGAGDSWLEILGCGMVHPNVIANCGLDPAIYQGFAFGMGIDRIAMLKYGIPDLRSFFDSDLRWLRHYGFSALEWPSLTGGLGR
jgi:phenylalanyl-tRNA synthetase alpha chain